MEAGLGISSLLDPATFPGAVAAGVVIFGLGWLCSWFLGRLAGRWEKHFRRFFPRTDETLWRFVLHLKSFLVLLISFMIFASIVPGLRAFLGTLVAGAGITAVIFGFAAKSTFANLISGVALAVYRPIRIGDTVKIEEDYGIIEDITLRHTVLLTWDLTRIVIPNEKLDQMTLVNYTLTDQLLLVRLEFGVSYDTDLDLARELLLDEARRCPHRMADGSAPDPPWVKVVGWGDFSITLRVNLYTKNVDDYWSARFHLIEAVKKRFDREGIEIPFPYRTVVFKKDLPSPPRKEDQASRPEEEGPPGAGDEPDEGSLP